MLRFQRLLFVTQYATMQAMARIVEQVRSLCQDLQHDVRECMCARVIVPLARSLGPEKGATTVILEDVLELIQVLPTTQHKYTSDCVSTLWGASRASACMKNGVTNSA